MAATAKLGDIVVFNPTPDLGINPRAGIVMDAYDDGTVDIHVFLGYAQGQTDFKKVAAFDTTATDQTLAQPRTFKSAATA